MESKRESRIRLGMVGGGQGGAIGQVHRIAARMDDQYELCAGALSSNPERAHASARELGLAADRSYDSYRQMAVAESARDDGIEAVAIVTPNDSHFDIARAFLGAGIHVICDKPMTVTVEEARALQLAAAKANCILAVTYNYSGYPMIRQARAMIERGDLGTLRVVQGQFAQQWLSEPLEASGHKQASWRTDPARSGAGGCIGDIGTHVYHLASFVTGLKLKALCADLAAFVEGRRLDDNAHIMLRFSGGARGMLWVSQVAVGDENSLGLAVYGDRAGLSWRQAQPDELVFTRLGEAPQRLTRGGPQTLDAASRAARVPPGHPEGYLEAFGVIYRDIALAIRAARQGQAPAANVTYPTGADGEAGVAFVHAAVRSSAAGGIWVEL